VELVKKHQLKGQVRLVGEDLNVLISVEEAWKRAEELGLDLCLVGQGDPPIVRILDFKKAEYERKSQQKKTPRISTKEVQFKVNISDHDLDTKLKKIRAFLEDKQRVKIVIKLKGREDPARGNDLLERILKQVGGKVTKLPGGALVE
jgi:translation initiation factor IF-3